MYLHVKSQRLFQHCLYIMNRIHPKHLKPVKEKKRKKNIYFSNLTPCLYRVRSSES